MITEQLAKEMLRQSGLSLSEADIKEVLLRWKFQKYVTKNKRQIGKYDYLNR